MKIQFQFFRKLMFFMLLTFNFNLVLLYFLTFNLAFDFPTFILTFKFSALDLVT
jgi:hypothetical protein